VIIFTRRSTIPAGPDDQEEQSSAPDPGAGELLRRLRAGDEEAFACLVDRHHAALVRSRSPARSARRTWAARTDLMEVYRRWQRDRET